MLKKKNPHQSEESQASQKQWMRNLLKAKENKQFKLYIVLLSDRQSNYLFMAKCMVPFSPVLIIPGGHGETVCSWVILLHLHWSSTRVAVQHIEVISWWPEEIMFTLSLMCCCVIEVSIQRKPRATPAFFLLLPAYGHLGQLPARWVCGILQDVSNKQLCSWHVLHCWILHLSSAMLKSADIIYHMGFALSLILYLKKIAAILLFCFYVCLLAKRLKKVLVPFDRN